MELVEEEQLFKENDIINKEYYSGIKNLINCSICLDIIKEPVQCSICQHCFCNKCASKLTNCPFRCENNNFFPSLICKQLLSGLIIKCKCGKEVGYDFIEHHKKEECIYADFKKNYFELKQKYEKLKQELNKLNDCNETCTENHIKSSLHPHPLECIKIFLNSWYCDNCDKEFHENEPSYHCTLCDFDLCYNCAKSSITKGSIVNVMTEYY